MQDWDELRDSLRSMDGRGYKAYKAVQGTWRFPDFELWIDHVQGDPFADPSRMRVLISPEVAGLPASAAASAARATGTACFLARAFATAARALPTGPGSGKSGRVQMEDPGQKVLDQTAVIVGANGSVEARLRVGLPANGRRVLGRAAAELVTERLPGLVRSTLLASAHDPTEIERHAATNEDATALRELLGARSLLAFVAEGALLPRLSGIDDRPLEGEEVVPFRSPESLATDVELPNAGVVRGMGVPEGVTLIVGGGFHGKSTLLRALEAGVYNHRPDDGRERVVTRGDALKVRAEDGRSVAGVDITPFIDGLPYGRDTRAFSTPNASGSTSQAAAIVEGIEAGARALLIDEDTSATNFMIRDHRMQQLVPADGEPITPFVDRVRALHETLDVSCVIVIGGSGDYLDVADTVIRMRDYRPEDVTMRAVQVAREHPTGRAAESATPFDDPAPRVVAHGSIDPSRGRRTIYVRVPDDRTLVLGDETIDLVAVEQLANRAQAVAIGRALAWLAKELPASITTALDRVDALLETGGFDALEPRLTGDMARFRRLELAAALNRLRTLRVGS